MKDFADFYFAVLNNIGMIRNTFQGHLVETDVVQWVYGSDFELLSNDNEQIYHKHINEQKALKPKTVKLKPLFRNDHKEMR